MRKDKGVVLLSTPFAPLDCRRLWQQVTASGNGRNGVGSHMVMPEPTVEDLVDAVRKLPPDASAVPAVAQG